MKKFELRFELSGNLSINDAKAHILRLYDQKRAKASADLANSINVIVHDVLEGRLPYEFIQNADDASLTNQGSLSFVLEGGILTISHDGKQFSPQDVEKICAVAQQKYLDKIEDHEMIGQKGIGAKVAFAEADELTVFSFPYCFRFQEKYVAWQTATRAEPYPWQITPIWTEVTELPKPLDPKQVHFILKLRNPGAIREQLNMLAADPRILMFLNRIRRLSIFGKELLMKVQLSGQRELYCNGKLVSSWIYHPDPRPIPENIRSKLKNDPEYKSCPDKLKNAEFFKLFFAFCIGAEGLVKAENTVLSCYLPTTVRCGFPSLVNADLLLEASRQRLKVNTWNKLILEQVARRHFHWLAQLAKEPRLRKGILNVLGPLKLEGVDPFLAEGYKTAYQECSATVKFIPSHQDPGQLRSLVDCYLDTTGFFRAFQATPPNERLLPSLIDDQLDNVTVLQTVHNIPTVTYAHLIQQSKTYLGHQPQLIRHYLEFFMKHWDRAVHFQNQFRQHCQLPNGYGSMSIISSFFLTSESSGSYPACLQIPVLPADCQSPVLKEWLHRKVGLRYLSPKEIIRGPLSTFVKEGKVDHSNTISILRFLYAALRNDEIKEFELPTLFPQMQVFSGKKTMRPASECYLADIYEPAFLLEKLIKDPALFISTEYLMKGDDVRVWKLLFLRLGVREQVTLNYPPAPQISQLRSQNVVYLNDYLSHLYTDSKTSPLRSKTDNASHILLNFAYIPFMNLLHLEAYAHHFWAEILRDWGTVHRMCRMPQYRLSNGTRDLKISYLQYVVQHMPICPSQGEPLPGKELYAPQLRDLVGTCFPTANIPYAMSDEQARFFGFRMEVDPFHCLEIFDSMRLSKNTDISRYAQLLQHLIEGFGNLSDLQQREFQKKTKYIIAEDGNWQACNSQLKCSLIPGAMQRFDRHDRVKIVMPLDMMKRLSTIMGFDTISPAQLHIEIPGTQEDETFTIDLRKKLPLIALCEALQLHKDPLAVMRQLIALARPLKIFQAPKIQLSTDSNDTTDVLLADNKIYYQKRCTEKKGKLGRKLCEYFQLSLAMQTLMPEILGLKEDTVMGDSKGIGEFLQETGIPVELLNRLKAVYSHKDCQLLEEGPPEEKKAADISLPLPPKDNNSLPGASSDTPPDALLPGDPPQQPPAAPQIPIDEKTSPVPVENRALEVLTDLEDEKRISESSFLPAIAADKANYGAVELRRVRPVQRQETQGQPDRPSPHGKADQPQRSERSRREVQDTKPIGQWGEEFIFHYLIYKYKNHNISNKTKLHFVRTEEIERGVKIVCLDDKKEELIVRLVWLNTTTESYQQRDLDLAWIRGDKVVKQRWIEVKTSVEDRVHFFLSGREWGFMNAHLQEFRIYHVASAGSPTPLVTKIKTLLSSGLRTLNSTEFVGST